MCKTNVCGDGDKSPSEACDDGNQSNDDACTNVCKLATCGDGFKQPGEECDAGMNNSNTGACTLACKNPVCGDTFVQPGKGEQCDDGNLSNNDACLNTCKSATCGDAIVYQGVEQCDDGNQSNNDFCSNQCVLPTCSDGVKNGSETDVDCGGSCGKCGLNLQCTGGLDCTTGYCNAGKCGIATSCKAIKQATPGAGNGVYPIDPDGAGAQQPFNVFCEMTIDGGGWTLALKANGTQSTFTYAAALWTNTATHQPQFPDLDHNEAKLQSFNTVPFADVLVGMEYPIGNGPLVLKTVKLAGLNRPSLQNLMSGAYVATAVGRNAWKSLIDNSSLQPNCNREGFNSVPWNVAGWPRTRIGIVSNQEANCDSPDSYIGIGGDGGQCNVSGYSVGDLASCGGDNGDKNLAAFGAVFVR
ncbi:fibrinogen-like YCDxxxxGGGW domain-containing protein [Nannocystis pusilla]|uniref:Fibrinogen-like YCDxxxxGGGW domain-containing protein n=1 Tax=Nannocystis pusilla TaxID=889268 RepID=A0A9X3J2T0_9BACT|nr:fibrinogen-like YCDxxxxGGGW domain-containing protein [Nannocystis pusilla]MCY1011413.1 fibrinogen-like YCDxxxxGGGW domain-containing protein [Nannocystis pusilla]